MKLELREISLALGAFSLELDATLVGRVSGIFGPSGAGKTTLLEVVAGLRRPRRARMALDGIEITNTAAKRFVRTEERRIGYVPQDGALFPHRNVQGNLSYALRAHGVRDGIEFDHVVDVLELRPFLDRRVEHLSGGEKQRVALGRALLAGPRLLLLDEPLAGLDAALKSRVIPYLTRVRDEFGIPMLYVTHSADEVVALCDDVLVLESGRVTRQGAPLELFEPSSRPHYQLRM